MVGSSLSSVRVAVVEVAVPYSLLVYDYFA